MNPKISRGLRLAATAGLALLGLFTAYTTAGGAASPVATTTTKPVAPRMTSQPRITGDTFAGGTVVASPGTWAGSTPMTFSYQWQRCASNGLNCHPIVGATSKSYVVATQDVGFRLRVTVTAKNSAGSASALSDPSPVIKKAPTPTTTTTAPAPSDRVALGGGVFSRSVTSVSLPDRLVIDAVKFSPNPLGSRRVVTARFRVASVNTGDRVRGALVYALALPYGQFRTAPEAITGTDGWATLRLIPTSRLNLRLGSIQVFVRARKPGDNLLAGVSTRRLVQFALR